MFEIIDANELAKRLNVRPSWIREQVRTRTEDQIPHLRLGKYRRFEWMSPALESWLANQRHGRGAR
jgi:hypothetical protein